MRLIDTHAHVHTARFEADRAAVLERAREAGVERIVEIGYDLASSRAAIALAHEQPMLAATAGIQPHYASETGAAELLALRELLAAPPVVALGEIGLDYYHNRAPRDEQIRLFKQQLAIAAELDLPVVIHSREAHDDTVDVLTRAARGLRIVMHAFGGDWDYAVACLELGAFLSFAGPVTFPKAVELHDVARRVPLDRMLTETDCPYLSPEPYRGKRNEPARVALVTQRIAELRGKSVDSVAEAVWANAHRVFPKLATATAAGG